VLYYLDVEYDMKRHESMVNRARGLMFVTWRRFRSNWVDLGSLAVLFVLLLYLRYISCLYMFDFHSFTAGNPEQKKRTTAARWSVWLKANSNFHSMFHFMYCVYSLYPLSHPEVESILQYTWLTDRTYLPGFQCPF
jgi:uncharacterized membrane protein